MVRTILVLIVLLAIVYFIAQGVVRTWFAVRREKAKDRKADKSRTTQTEEKSK